MTVSAPLFGTNVPFLLIAQTGGGYALGVKQVTVGTAAAPGDKAMPIFGVNYSIRLVYNNDDAKTYSLAVATPTTANGNVVATIFGQDNVLLVALGDGTYALGVTGLPVPPPAVTWQSYVASLAPVGWWQFTETSGSTAVNSGSAGSAADGAITSATLGQTGKLGANQAFSWDGTNTKVQVPNVAALANLTAFEYVWLLNPTNAGEGNFGSPCWWGTGGSNQGLVMFCNGGLAALAFDVWNTGGTAFGAGTAPGLSASTWALLFASYDDAGDRKAHVYKGISGAVNQIGVTAALTGTYQTPTLPLVIGNNTAQNTTWNGLIDELVIFNGALSSAQRTQLCTLAGV